MLIISARSLIPLCFITAIDAFVPVGKSVTNFAPTRSSHIIAVRRFDRQRVASGVADQSSEPEYTMPHAPSTNTIEPKFDQLVTLVGKSASSLVSISFFVLLATRRDALTLTLFIGSIFNAVSSKVMKKLLNIQRPANLQSNENVKLKPSDGGMPSSHAMSLGFIGTVITLAIIPIDQQYLAGAAMVLYSLLALRYRVRDHLHTVDQVAVGLTLGLVNALVWLTFALGTDRNGFVMKWVTENCVSTETGLFPYAALAIPVVVGVLAVGSFERRIALWLKEKNSKGQ